VNLGKLLIVGVAMCLSTLAHAKPARCFTTDDGYYQCDFRGLDSSGSFRLSARGYPTYTLNVENGFAFGTMTLSGNSVSLPGRYVRSPDDGACWQNPETNTKICAG
jgi:hypothetical protein